MAKKAAWRLDPEESFSDWKITVTKVPHHEDKAQSSSTTPKEDDSGQQDAEESGRSEPVVYNVHKVILGMGQRKCDYFSSLFKSQGLKESNTFTTELSLDESATDCFPMFLDYVYHEEGNDFLNTIHAKEAMTLRHLASYFGLPELESQMLDVVQARFLKSQSIVEVCRQALLYNDDRTMQLSLLFIANGHGKEIFGRGAPEWNSPVQEIIEFLPATLQRDLMKMALGFSYFSFQYRNMMDNH